LRGRWPLYLAGGIFSSRAPLFSSGAGLVFLATSESARSSSLGFLPNPIQGDFSFGRGLGTKKVFLTRYIIDGPSVRTGLDEKR